jgi:hypothetical protein
MDARVTVTVNGKPMTLFLGMCVRHAIGARTAAAVAAGRSMVTTGDGSLVGLDGALYEGEALLVRRTSAPEPLKRRKAAAAKPGGI